MVGQTTLMDAIRLALYGQRAQCSTRGNLSYSEFLSQSVNRHCTRGTNLYWIGFLSWITYQWNSESNGLGQNPKGGKDILGVLVDDWPNTALAQIWDERIEDFLLWESLTCFSWWWTGKRISRTGSTSTRRIWSDSSFLGTGTSWTSISWYWYFS